MIEQLIKLARERLFDGERLENVAHSLGFKAGDYSLGHLAARAAELDLRARRKPDLQSFKLPLRRKERRAGRVWWVRR
jgi:hypothetical protein